MHYWDFCEVHFSRSGGDYNSRQELQSENKLQLFRKDPSFIHDLFCLPAHDLCFL